MSQAQDDAVRRTQRAMDAPPQSRILILPSDSNSVASLKKQLLASLRPPKEQRFEELRGQGFDSETAMELSGMDYDLHAPSTVSTVLDAARRYDDAPTIGYEVARSSAYEVPSALRTIGSATGAAVGSAMGLSAIRYIAKNSRMFGICAGVLGVGLVSVFTAKIVAATLGKTMAGIAVANVISASGIVIAAVLSRGK